MHMAFLFRKFLVFISVVAAGFFSIHFLYAAPVNCGSYTTSTPPPAEYGAAYNVFSPSQMLFKVSCDASGALLQVGNTNQVVYEKGYYYKNGWKDFTMTGSRYADSRSVYLKGPVEHVIPESLLADDVNYVVTYTCVNQSGQWKCGCSDTSCAQGKWQLQAFNKSAVKPPPQACSITSPCPGGTPCVNGQCTWGLECNVGPGGINCPAGKTCINGYCVPGSGNICNTTPGGYTCPSGQTCLAGRCVIGSGNICNTTPGGYTCPAGETCGPDNRCRL